MTKLGSTGPEVFPIALGCMGMSGMYGESDEVESIATIHEAIERGIDLLDTGDFYGMGHNEMLIGRALKTASKKPRLSVKFGGLRGPDGSFNGIDTRPAAIKNFLAYSLVRLGVDHVDVYRPARLDPAVPIEDTVGAIADLVKQGYVRHIGLSEVGVDTIRRAHAVHPVVDLQIEYAIVSRGPEAEIFPLLRELGIAVTAYGVLSRGLLTGSKPTGQGDFRAHLPRFAGDNGVQNQRLVDTLAAIAKERNITPAQLALAWVLSKGSQRSENPGELEGAKPSRRENSNIVPVMGARTRKQLRETLGALEVRLGEGEIARIEREIPADRVAGSRYQEAQMRHLDSEKSIRV